MPMTSMPGMNMPMPTDAGGVSIPDSAIGRAIAWLVMVTAMMVPAALPAVRALAVTASRPGRQRTIAVFLTTYLGVWMLFGLLAISFVMLLQHAVGIGVTSIAAMAFVAAAIWELTPWKRRSLRACRAVTPLSSQGRDAVWACAHAGCRQGVWCACGCWAVMLAMAATMSVGLLMMGLLTLFVLLENTAARGTRLAVAMAVTTLAAAIVTVTA